MRIMNTRHLALALAMLAAAGLAFALTPRDKVADQGPKLDLDRMIPKQFGAWNMDENIVPLQPDPETTALLDKLYNQTLMRTYVNDKGERIMLSIAYGGDQSESMQVHKPEVCYPAQGFQVVKEFDAKLDTGVGTIPVRRLVTAQGMRIEPVTYWMTIGDKVAFGHTASWKLEQLRFGLTGKIPDGLLFRVSSISDDDARAYALQDRFVKEMLNALPAESRTRLIGRATL
ncbi:MAG: EpsI family protein [Hydrogenophilaceae bacterium]|nr:EpsI family protein [Hydrogenophilaceae bacterium]